VVPARERELIDVLTEQNVHPIKGDGAATDDRARSNCAPEDICTGETPDRQQGSEHCHQYACARYPERQTPDFRRVQVAAFFWDRTAH
jgi:hypothetical protein